MEFKQTLQSPVPNPELYTVLFHVRDTKNQYHKVSVPLLVARDLSDRHVFFENALKDMGVEWDGCYTRPI